MLIVCLCIILCSKSFNYLSLSFLLLRYLARRESLSFPIYSLWLSCHFEASFFASLKLSLDLEISLFTLLISALIDLNVLWTLLSFFLRSLILSAISSCWSYLLFCSSTIVLAIDSYYLNSIKSSSLLCLSYISKF